MMKQRIPSIALLIALLICLYAQPAAAATDESLFDWRVLPDGSGVQLVRYNGTGVADIVIPEYVSGRPVFSIAPDAFVLFPEEGEIEPRTDIRSVYIPDTVTDIGAYAFWQISSLESIHLPVLLTSLSDGVLCGCTSLRTLELPAGLTSIGTGALSGLEAVESLTIPSGIESIGEAAFANDFSLRSLSLPWGMGEIPGWAFQNCTSLTSFSVPQSVVRIGAEAFAGCTNLSVLNLPVSVLGIGELAFSDCRNLSKVLYSGTRTQFERIAIQGPTTPEDCPLLYADIQYLGGNSTPELPEPVFPEGVAVAADSPLRTIAVDGGVYGTGYTAARTTAEALHVQELEAQFVCSPEISVAILASGGAPLSPDDVCGTGTLIIFFNKGEQIASVTLVVAGDVTGSGVISLTQLVRMAQAFNGSVTLTGPYLMAGDFTGTGTITLTDLVREARLYT